MDAKKVELVAHHSCLCAQHPFKRARASHGVIRRTTSPHCSADHRLCPRPCAGSASNLAAFFRSFLLSFREDLSRWSLDKFVDKSWLEEGELPIQLFWEARILSLLQAGEP